jgi:hypothetical protein
MREKVRYLAGRQEADRLSDLFAQAVPLEPLSSAEGRNIMNERVLERAERHVGIGDKRIPPEELNPVEAIFGNRIRFTDEIPVPPLLVEGCEPLDLGVPCKRALRMDGNESAVDFPRFGVVPERRMDGADLKKRGRGKRGAREAEKIVVISLERRGVSLDGKKFFGAIEKPSPVSGSDGKSVMTGAGAQAQKNPTTSAIRRGKYVFFIR